MKIKELRNMTAVELEQKMTECYKKLLKMRSGIKTGRLEKPNEIRIARRDIAKIKTLLKERNKEQ